jgi:hypothetical protein
MPWTGVRSRWAHRRREREQLRELLDRAQITDVLRTYATAVDRRDVELIKTVYHPDAFDDHGDWKGDITEFIAIAPGFWATFEMTMHMMGLPLITFDPARRDTATAETYAVAYHRRAGRDGVLKDDVWGVRYLDVFERRDGQWRIARRTMTRDWRRVDVATETARHGER